MHPSILHPPASAIPKHMRAAFALAVLATPLGACNDRAAAPVERAAMVHTEIVQPRDGQAPSR